MENLHEPESRPWISPKLYSKDFLEEWLELTRGLPVGIIPDEEPDPCRIFMDVTNCTQEEYEELDLLTDESALRCPYEDDIDVSRRVFCLPDDINLETVQSQVADMEKRNNSNRYKGFVYCTMKFWNYPESVPFSIREQLAKMRDEENKLELPDYMYTVQIYRPEVAIFRYQKNMLARTASFHIDQEFCVLGCQYLTELRDKISCVSDLAVDGDLGDNPDEENDICMKDIYKSGFFYVNSVFYNDMRDPYSKDYSKNIIEWAHKEQRGVGPFFARKMEDTKFNELVLQLGYPYLYMHQGNCEHIIVFSDIRVVTEADSWCRTDYPLISRKIPKKRLFCMVCHIHTSSWVVSKNRKLPEDPYFFCDECFRLFHYSKDMTKMMDFEARRYICRSILD